MAKQKIIIVQISSVYSENTGSAGIYGLGKDGLVYWWDWGKGEWVLHAYKK